MSHITQVSFEGLLTTRQLAKIYNLSAATLNTLRSRQGSNSPPYYKINSSVRYLKHEFEAWLEEQKIDNGETA